MVDQCRLFYSAAARRRGWEVWQYSEFYATAVAHPGVARRRHRPDWSQVFFARTMHHPPAQQMVSRSCEQSLGAEAGCFDRVEETDASARAGSTFWQVPSRRGGGAVRSTPGTDAVSGGAGEQGQITSRLQGRCAARQRIGRRARWEWGFLSGSPGFVDKVATPATRRLPGRDEGFSLRVRSRRFRRESVLAPGGRSPGASSTVARRCMSTSCLTWSTWR